MKSFICSMNLGLKAFMAVVLVSFLSASVWAQENPGLDDLETIAKILTDMKSADLKQVSGSLEKADDPELYNQDIFEATVQAYATEMARVIEKGELPNTFVFNGIFKLLASLAADSNMEILKEVEKTFLSSKDKYEAGFGGNANSFIKYSLPIWQDFQSALQNPPLKELPPAADWVADTGITFNKESGEYEGPSEEEVQRFKRAASKIPSIEVEGQQTLWQQIAALPPDENGFEFAPIFLQGTLGIVRDDQNALRESGLHMPVKGRDKEVEAVINIFARIEKRNAALLGPGGVGKSSIMRGVDDAIHAGKIGDTRATQALKDLIIVETSSARIGTLAKSNDENSQAAALELYWQAAKAVQKALGVPIAIYADEAHQISKPMGEAMKRFMVEPDGLRLALASTATEYNMRFKDNGPWNRRIEVVGVEELPEDIVFEIIQETWVPLVKEKYGVDVPDEIIRKVIKEAAVIKRINGLVDGSKDLIQDLAVANSIGVDDEDIVVADKKILSTFIKKFYALPADPNNPKEFLAFMKDLEEKMNTEVLGQERMVKDILELFAGLMKNPSKTVGSAYVVGKTGTGKTHFALTLAEALYGNKGAFFEINGNEYQTGGMGLNSLVGAPNGVISSDTTPGSLMEWLDDPGRGKNGGILLLNEADKMDPELFERIMELLDKGKITGGDGKVRYVKKLMVMFTSNRNAKGFFPDAWEKWSQDEMRAHVNRLTSEKIKEKMSKNYSGQADDSKKLADEILGRVDTYTVATPITPDVAREISDQRASAFIAQQQEGSEVDFEVDPGLLDFLSQMGFSSIYGARPLIRLVDGVLSRLATDFLVHDKASNDDGEYVPNAKLSYDGETSEYVVSFGKGKAKTEIRTAAPKLGTDDPMSDPAFVEKIMNFEDNMKKKIFGQDEMIERISQAIMAHMGSPESSLQALSLFLVGSTGTGKSETAKAIAEVFFGSRERTAIIDMGRMTFSGSMNNVFNPPKGFVSGSEPGLFEQALMNNPEGGVLLFDEISNMGSGDPETRSAMLKQLYAIMDEPTWTSTATGETYDLNKWIFIMTGNDGEKLFSGVDSDDLRSSIWKSNKSRAKVIEMLRAEGVPEAMLGRCADVILQKPLTRDLVGEKLAPKFLDPITKMMRDKGFDVTTDDDFAFVFGNTFFSQAEGGRSVRKVAESHLVALNVKIRALLSQQGLTPEDVKVELSIADNLPGDMYVENASDFERSVELVAKVKSSGRGQKILFESKVNVTEFADTIHLTSRESAKRTAFHEVGHGFVNDSEKSLLKLAFVTLKGRGKYLGYARYEPVKGENSFSRETLIARLAYTLAGSAAQQLAGYPADSGMSQDLAQSREMAREAVMNSGIFPEVAALVPPDADPKKPLSGPVEAVVQKLTQELFQESWRLAVDHLSENWGQVNNVVHYLMDKGEISGEQFEAAKFIEQKEMISLTEESIAQAKAYGERLGGPKIQEPPAACLLED